MAEIRMERGSVKWSAEGSENFVTQERKAAMDFFRSPEIVPIMEAVSAPSIGSSIHHWASAPLDLAEFKRAVDVGRGPLIIRPRDEITVMLTDGRPATARCEGFDKATGKHPYFVFSDCLGKGKMNEEGGNKGGYYGSDGRAYVLGALYDLLPQDLQAIIMPRELVEIIGGKEVRYSDPLWLPSATDVFGPRTLDSRWWADEPDSFWLPGFARERDRVKEYRDDPDYGTCYWWLRSPNAGNTTNFCFVDANGNAGSYHAYYSYGFAPGFCV